MRWEWGDEDDVPEPAEIIAEHRRVIDALAPSMTARVEGRAEVTINQLDEGACLAVIPHNAAAMPMWIVAERQFDIQLGDSSCRFRLGYGPTDRQALDELIEAVVAGRAFEVRAWNRWAVRVPLASGRTLTETVSSISGLLLPLPGWTRWGSQTTFRPY